jgi:hypothetical protein
MHDMTEDRIPPGIVEIFGRKVLGYGCKTLDYLFEEVLEHHVFSRSCFKRIHTLIG